MYQAACGAFKGIQRTLELVELAEVLEVVAAQTVPVLDTDEPHDIPLSDAGAGDEITLVERRPYQPLFPGEGRPRFVQRFDCR